MFPKTEQVSKCYVLSFFYDDDDASALAFLVNGIRFYVIVEPQKLDVGGYDDSRPKQHYLNRLRLYKTRDNNDSVSAPKKKDVTVEPSSSTISETSDPKTPKHPESNEDDVTIGEDDGSAIRCGDADNREVNSEKVSDLPELSESDKVNQSTENPDLSLQDWIISLFAPQLGKLATVESHNASKSLREWYNPKTYFFELGVENGVVCPIELEESPDLWKRVNDLVPKLPLPKYIREYDIQWLRPTDLEVVSESDSPAPFHPNTVRKDGSILFFKPVDATQPSPTKREIKILKQIERLGLHKEFRVPVISGFVGHENSKIDVMGFLLTNIEEPTPLTLLLDSHVPQAKRDKWAQESERIIQILHDNNIVWGDAKADNFMVDKNEDLWIIDFGGSYTDGWIDPNLMETKEGDEMGVEKVLRALGDPVTNTLDEDAELEKSQQVVGTAGQKDAASRKRKFTEDEEDVEKDEVSKKQR